MGDMVNHRQTIKSFKNHKIIYVPKDEWIIVSETHEALVDRETFDKVQKIAATKKRTNKRKNDNIFSGILKCYDCGSNLSFVSDTRKYGGEGFYTCSGYKHQVHRHITENRCSPHHISYHVLYDSVLTQIQRLIHMSKADDNGDFLQDLLDSRRSKVSDDSQKSLNMLNRRSQELKRVIKKIVEQNANGVITDEMFADLYTGYQDELTKVSAKLDALETVLTEAKKGETDAELFTELIKRQTSISELSRELLVDLVDHIEVHEATGSRYDGTRHLETEVFYRLIGAVGGLGGDGSQ